MPQIEDPKTFTIADPRTFEGDAFEVADRAVAQAEAVARLLGQMLPKVTLMTRNAELERAIISGDDLPETASGYPESPQGKLIERIEDKTASVYKSLGALRAAAGYNPKAPIKE